MDRLLAMHREHGQRGVAPEVEAAWLHHRFTQIHPFQDGNGRVARALATLVMIRAGWFPLVVTDAGRADYIEALEIADGGAWPTTWLHSAASGEAQDPVEPVSDSPGRPGPGGLPSADALIVVHGSGNVAAGGVQR